MAGTPGGARAGQARAFVAMSFTALGKWKVLEGFMNGFRLGRVLGSGSLRSGQGAVMRYFRSAVTQSIGLATSCLVLWVTWANAQQTITLSCDGMSKLMATSAGDLKPDPINQLGIIVNFTDRTVRFSDYVIPISGVTGNVISFVARQAPLLRGLKFKPFTLEGAIDRVTGDTTVSWWHEDMGSNASWGLTCRPAKRPF